METLPRKELMIEKIINFVKENEGLKLFYEQRFYALVLSGLDRDMLKMILERGDVKGVMKLIQTSKAISEYERKQNGIFWQDVFYFTFPEYANEMKNPVRSNPTGNAWKNCALWLTLAHSMFIKSMKHIQPVYEGQGETKVFNPSRINFEGNEYETRVFASMCYCVGGRLLAPMSDDISETPSRSEKWSQIQKIALRDYFIDMAEFKVRVKLAAEKTGKMDLPSIIENLQKFARNPSQYDVTLLHYYVGKAPPRAQKTDERNFSPIYLGCSACQDQDKGKFKCSECQTKFCSKTCGEEHLAEMH